MKRIKPTDLIIALVVAVIIMLSMICVGAREKVKLQRENKILLQTRADAIAVLDNELEGCKAERDKLKVENLRLRDEDVALRVGIKAYQHATVELTRYHIATVTKMSQNYAAHVPLDDSLPPAPTLSELMGMKVNTELAVKSD